MEDVTPVTYSELPALGEALLDSGPSALLRERLAALEVERFELRERLLEGLSPEGARAVLREQLEQARTEVESYTMILKLTEAGAEGNTRP